jgi:two-component system OmpR family sensor kinase
LQAGFFDTPEYRVYSLFDAPHRVWLQLADPLEERNEASERTLLGLVAVLLVMLPVLAWLIHWIARRELHSVRRLQQQITARSGSNLQALDLAHMPQELRAVGDGVNQLLGRLGEALNVERSLAANAAHELRTPWPRCACACTRPWTRRSSTTTAPVRPTAACPRPKCALPCSRWRP